MTAPAPAIPFADKLDAALTRHGLDRTLTAADGTTVADAWTNRFTILTQPIQADPEVLVYEHLGENLQIGRHRGGPWLVWQNIDLPLSHNAEAGQWLRVEQHPEGWDDPKMVLAAEFHTRNGGGNRECWCPSSNFEQHQNGCLAQVIDRLQAHPAHLHDQDDDGDSTYANFYFTIPKTDTIRASVEVEATRRAHHAAQTLLDAIIVGTSGPWDVFEPNPQTAARIATLNKQAPAPVVMPRLKVDQPRWVGVAAKALAELDLVIAYMRDETTDEPAPTRDAWASVGVKNAMDWHTTANACRRDRDVYQRTMQDMEAGALPDHVVQVLIAEKIGDRMAYLEKQAESYGACASKHLTDFLSDREALGAYQQAVEAKEAAKNEADALAWSLRWPGVPDTCPPVPELTPVEDSWGF